MQVVPFTSDVAQTFTCTLNGVEYDFFARWADRTGIWYADIVDSATQTPLAKGIALLIGCDLLEPYALGIGSMYVVDTAATKTPSTPGGVADELHMDDAGADDLGTRVIVVFLAPGEVLA